MELGLPLLIFAVCLAFGFVFFATALAGIKRGRIYYEPNSPPIELHKRPLAFVACCSLTLGIAIACLAGLVWSAVQMWSLL